MKRFFALALSLLLLVGVLTGCNSAGGGNSGKPVVYTSFYPMYHFTSLIAGDLVDLRLLVPSDTEPHDWEISTQDMASLEQADFIIYNGAGLENFIDAIKQSVENKDLTYVETAGDIPLLEDHGSSDPHVWLNPLYALKQMEAIKNALCEKDEKNQSTYEENYEAIKQKIEDLDGLYKERVAGFKSHEFIVSHGAYSYLCDAYGLTQIPLEGLASESEPSAADMAEITDYIKENNVKYIFVGPQSNSDAMNTLAKETGVEVSILNAFEYGDEAYLTVMEDNLEALSAALS